MVAGGYDVLCRFVMRGFNALKALTRDDIRPFDRRRSGLLLGEAAALVLLRRERDAAGPRLGTLLGYGSASDAAHISAPDPEGQGLERAVRAALRAAGIGPDAVDFVSAHGTGTRSTTRSRPRSSGACSGRARRPCPSARSSRASATPCGRGRARGADVPLCLPPRPHSATLHLDEPGSRLRARPRARRSHRAARPRISLSTSLGFGGCRNAALVLEGAP